ncbi:hypothetical protein PAPYR_1857 [Paratrimastix pyriformis]|uniref:Uncharacterized protein n=1 Tax=Paratrimastix pyriformis TaxID=342808 RepID=A0ABQ8URG1_9EUKA|nr:hypothetical protein PAPYR_1857 [Paratrimastix pyriformis]
MVNIEDLTFGKILGLIVFFGLLAFPFVGFAMTATKRAPLPAPSPDMGGEPEPQEHDASSESEPDGETKKTD